MRYRFHFANRLFQVDLLSRNPLRVNIIEGDQTTAVDLDGQLADGVGRLFLGDRFAPYFVTADKKGIWVTLAGNTWFFEKKKQQSEETSTHGGFVSPMPGKVIKLLVSDGQVVEKGEVLVVMEAMKMEHRIEAPCPGTVTALYCQVGQLVDQDFTLLSFEAKQ